MDFLQLRLLNFGRNVTNKPFRQMVGQFDPFGGTQPFDFLKQMGNGIGHAGLYRR